MSVSEPNMKALALVALEAAASIEQAWADYGGLIFRAQEGLRREVTSEEYRDAVEYVAELVKEIATGNAR